MLASAYRKQVRLLDQLHKMVQLMRWELCYKLTPLPDLCKDVSGQFTGILSKIMSDLSQRMEHNSDPDVRGCMHTVLENYSQLPPRVKRLLIHLGNILGRYDLEGQLQGMDSIIQLCEREYTYLEKDRATRVQSFRTLGICAGIALSVIFV